MLRVRSRLRILDCGSSNLVGLGSDFTFLPRVASIRDYFQHTGIHRDVVDLGDHSYDQHVTVAAGQAKTVSSNGKRRTRRSDRREHGTRQLGRRAGAETLLRRKEEVHEVALSGVQADDNVFRRNVRSANMLESKRSSEQDVQNGAGVRKAKDAVLTVAAVAFAAGSFYLYYLVSRALRMRPDSSRYSGRQDGDPYPR